MTGVVWKPSFRRQLIYSGGFLVWPAIQKIDPKNVSCLMSQQQSQKYKLKEGEQEKEV
jgi:hypothetical protein